MLVVQPMQRIQHMNIIMQTKLIKNVLTPSNRLISLWRVNVIHLVPLTFHRLRRLRPYIPSALIPLAQRSNETCQVLHYPEL